MVPGIEQRSLTLRDGTEIGYQRRGDRGPWVVLANGLGGCFEAYRHVYSALGDDYRTLCFDYRGLVTSRRPASLATLTVEQCCDDLEQLLDHEGADEAVFVGWSMGVQVNFEFFRARRERMAGMVCINGTAGRPFDTALSSRFVRYVIPSLLRAIRAQQALVGLATRQAVDYGRAAVPLLQRVGLVSRTLDIDAFLDVAATFRDVDWEVYTTLMGNLGEHDASDVLDQVDLPCSIITGDRDILTPLSTAERLHRAIPGSRLVVIRGGTHYTPVEYPGVIQEEVMQLLARAYGRTGTRAIAGRS